MAGTLTVGTITDGTNSTSATNTIVGSGKFWVNINGAAAGTARGSYNMSSFTRNATGDYTFNLSTAMADANYSVVSGGNYINARGDTYSNHNAWTAAYAASTTQMNIQFLGPTSYYDAATICGAIYR